MYLFLRLKYTWLVLVLIFLRVAYSIFTRWVLCGTLSARYLLSFLVATGQVLKSEQWCTTGNPWKAMRQRQKKWSDVCVKSKMTIFIILA